MALIMKNLIHVNFVEIYNDYSLVRQLLPNSMAKHQFGILFF